MELKDFIKGVILDIEWAKNEIAKEINKDVNYWTSKNWSYWIDFDLMVINEEWQIWKWQWWMTNLKMTMMNKSIMSKYMMRIRMKY